MKKIWNKIKLAWYYLIQGLIAADKVIVNEKTDTISPNTEIQQQQEQQSVIKDLLRGEVTEEVKELRHEMYYSERKSHEYVYNGGGNAKKNTMFDYKGSAETSDGNPIKLVLNNKLIVNGLTQDGVAVYGENVAISENLQGNFKISEEYNHKYSIEITRDFFPRFPLEKYTTKLVVKDVKEKEGKALLDFYIPSYKQQFNNVTKLLQSELDKIYQGETKSDLVQFTSIRFITKNCYGSPDLYLFEYKNPIFEDIIKFDGSYVLRFYCDININGEDQLNKYYNKATAEKNERHEAREGAVIDFNVEAMKLAKENFDTSEMENLFDKIKEKKC